MKKIIALLVMSILLASCGVEDKTTNEEASETINQEMVETTTGGTVETIVEETVETTTGGTVEAIVEETVETTTGEVLSGDEINTAIDELLNDTVQ